MLLIYNNYYGKWIYIISYQIIKIHKPENYMVYKYTALYLNRLLARGVVWCPVDGTF